jgi:hypothetical protein
MSTEHTNNPDFELDWDNKHLLECVNYLCKFVDSEDMGWNRKTIHEESYRAIENAIRLRISGYEPTREDFHTKMSLECRNRVVSIMYLMLPIQVAVDNIRLELGLNTAGRLGFRV